MRFAEKLIAWQQRHGRHDLPWQGTTDPYRIWLSEVMLQQTQVFDRHSVLPALPREISDGEGARSRERRRSARALERPWLLRARPQPAQGSSPHCQGGLSAHGGEDCRLPGVGSSTAAAIAAFAFGERGAILDGNVKRVLSRCFLLADKDEMWKQAEALLPRRGIERYTQALMDLGATTCTRRFPAARLPGEETLQSAQGRPDRRVPAAARAARAATARGDVARAAKRCAVLVEQRPSPGIWGGLWCFPELNGKRAARRQGA